MLDTKTGLQVLGVDSGSDCFNSVVRLDSLFMCFYIKAFAINL